MALRTRLIIFCFIAAISILIDAYIFKNISFLAAGYQAIGSEYIFVSTVLILLLLIAFLSFQSRKEKNLFSLNYFTIYIGIFITKLIYACLLLLHDLGRFLFMLASGVGNGSLKFTFPGYSYYFSVFTVIISLVSFLLILYGIGFGKYRYKVHKHILYIDDLPQAFQGFKIVQISDIHSGSFTRESPVLKGISLINEQEADLFVFTGDLVNNEAEEIEPWIEHFKQIKAPYGKYSILGNHDYGDYISWPDEITKKQNLDKLKQAHQDLEFRLLLDESIVVEKDNEQLYILGVENWGLGFGQRGDLKRALNDVPHHATKILLSHDPSHWDAEVKTHETPIHLTLSGHTHGMQFGIELFGWKWSPVKYRYRNWAGFTEENNRYLYVNRGFGFLGFSGRVGIWPEITLLELRKKL